MQTLKHYLIIALPLFFLGCNVSSKPINYGSDGCYSCKMTIVDKTHAAQIVTKKGKVYNFDSTECMLEFMKEFNAKEIALYLSNNFTQPEVLIDATNATFLISKNIPSPMGAFLSAFQSETEALKFQSENGGMVFSWDELQAYLNK